MRDIKFRVWDKQRNEFLSAGCVLISVEPGIRPAENPQFLDILKDADRYRDRFILMQFTGLKDKNCKEIFEGDIVRKNYGPNEFDGNDLIEHGSVGWVDGGLWFIKKDHNFYNLRSMPLEIIGNIYENPELI